MYCSARHPLVAECGGNYVGVCSLSKVRAVFSTQEAEVEVLFAERGMYTDAICSR